MCSECDNDDFVIYAGVINGECENFKLNELTFDSFKCLIFIQDLTSNKDAEIRSMILTKQKNGLKNNSLKISEKCQHMMNLKLDTARMEERYFTNT